MTILQAIILGFIQGITEILPISSSAHLIIIPTLLNWQVQSLSFDVFLQAATLLSIIIYFRAKLSTIIKGMFSALKTEQITYRKLGVNLLLSALPVIPFYLLSKNIIENITNLPALVIILLILFGIPFIFITQVYQKNNKNITSLSSKNALVIGIFQSFSLISGVSRSGITTIGSLTQGLKKEQAQEYAFLAGILTIGASFVFELYRVFQQPLEEPLINLVVSGVVAFVVCYFTIGLLMRFIKSYSLKIFGYYRIIIGVLFLIYLLIK